MMDFAVPLATSPNTEVRNPVVCWVDLLKGTNEVQKPTIYLKITFIKAIIAIRNQNTILSRTLPIIS